MNGWQEHEHGDEELIYFILTCVGVWFLVIFFLFCCLKNRLETVTLNRRSYSSTPDPLLHPLHHRSSISSSTREPHHKESTSSRGSITSSSPLLQTIPSPSIYQDPILPPLPITLDPYVDKVFDDFE